ncbi:BofC C-terminal domain-containing protein [Paenibacillus polymyxa]|uniref:BofC C-terminal domain-containing protein n=1 Tax=Paenibacillus polymyxa TaxID=1406 RepID=UPI001580917E|nr:BofC C-terminal domain-containing protein [Paenibacillus polymyxa]MBY0023040.1 BofC C-terminal domain-containing protein [Paenibacillus polymyxa]MBY0057247.1 BofC C-terminal domain-containing protein [Paenibacillus polymyxa]MBY0070555.1 BofC C-terminal domain-containing protein [Paenibacillus polymyxa]MBY0079462.1 BofC C-terminal domain-containing protein [Paenibacillus polymyxa]MBZ6444590.1 BofC C-terminal domain-containing protein [Paenibacillus polymyxa]
MKRLSWKKQMKRRWKQWRRAVWACTIFSAACLLAGLGVLFSNHMQAMLSQPLATPVMAEVEMKELSYSPTEDHSPQMQLLQSIRASGISRKTRLLTTYVCGTETTSLGTLSSKQLENLLKQHPDWKGRLNTKGEVWLERRVEDLSESCKERAYMGLSTDGQLTLFEGLPKKEKVIRTFFQLDIGSMETALPEGVYKQLQQGIRVQDINEYNSVISTFSDFAVERTQRVLKQHY